MPEKQPLTLPAGSDRKSAAQNPSRDQAYRDRVRAAVREVQHANREILNRLATK